MEKRKKTISKVLSVAVTLLLVLSLILCIWVVSQLLMNGYVKLFRQSFFRVITPSMEPELCVGELICITDRGLESVQTGDIVSFRSVAPETGGLFITHRVVNVVRGDEGEYLLLTKGDANLSADAYYVTEENYLGTLVWSSGRESLLSDFLAFFSSKNAFLICIVFPCLLICGFILKDSVNKICKDLEAVKRMEREEASQEEPPGDSPTGADLQESGAQERGEPQAEESEEYEALVLRIREELIEELKQSDGQTKKE